MKRLSLLIKPASSLCNMRCAYCFYHDVGEHRENASYGIMSRENAEKIIAGIDKDLDDGDGITVAFQGGEPTLAGLGWFEHFVETMGRRKKVNVNYALQTNGVLIDDNWAEFLKKNRFLTGLSIDANQKLHNRVRLDANGQGSWDACLAAKAAMDRHKADYNILCVLTNELAAEPDKAWNFMVREKVDFIQFIPCLAGLEDESPFALRPARFASFYTRLYQFWTRELEKGKYYSVKLFDDTANWFLRGVPSACGINGRCNAQYVIEADGSVYPCDFYVLDKYNTGKLTEKTLRELFETEVMQGFIREEKKLPGLCRSCAYLRHCNGGCKRMSGVMYFGAPGSPSFGSVCGYKMFLDKCLGPLEHTVRRFFPQAPAPAIGPAGPV